MAPPGKKVDNALASMLLASMAISVALFGAPNSTNNAMAAAGANKNTEVKANTVAALLAANPFDQTCMNAEATGPGTAGACTYCKFGCFTKEGGGPGAASGACLEKKASDEDRCPNMPEMTPEQMKQMNETRKAKQKIPRGADCTGSCMKFLGQDDFTTIDMGQMIAYFIGIVTPAGFFLFLGICSCCGLCNFCYARCPCGPEYKSDDTQCVAQCKSMGTNTFCPVTSHDNILWACIKCIICPGCPNPCGRVCWCCCPAKPVVNYKPAGEGNFVYSGGLKAGGDPQYATNYAGRTEPMNCCGGVYPSIQYASCGCGEWGCCCDCCFGCCECLNPCCRLNLFDYERATGGDPGYSLMQGRMLTLTFIVIILFLIIGMSTVGAGKDMFLCGLKSFMPSMVATVDALLGWIVSFSGFLVAVAEILDATIEATGMASVGLAGTITTGLGAGVKAGFSLKTMLCPLLGGTEVVDGIFNIFVSVTSYIGFLVMGLGALGWLFSNSCGRLSLHGASLAVIAGFLSIMLYVFVDPLALLLSDMCVLFDNLRTLGAMEGFPGKAPDMCGPNGTMKAFPEQTQVIASTAKENQCKAYSELCNSANLPGGTIGTIATVICPPTSGLGSLQTDAAAFFFDATNGPLLPTLEFEVCTPEEAPAFYKKFDELNARTTGTIINNVRFGCIGSNGNADASLKNKLIVNYNNVASTACDWTFDSLHVDTNNLKKKFAKSKQIRQKTVVPADWKTPTEVCSTNVADSGQDNFMACYGGPVGKDISATAGDKWYPTDPLVRPKLAGEKDGPPKDSAFEISGTGVSRQQVTVASKFTSAASATVNAVVEVAIMWKPRATPANAAACQTQGQLMGTGAMVVSSLGLASTFTGPDWMRIPGQTTGSNWDNTDAAKYTMVGGVCTYRCTTADVTAGKCNIGCGKMAANLPAPCETKEPTIAQCGSGQSNPRNGLLPKELTAPFNPVCDNQLLQMKTNGLDGFNQVIAKIDAVDKYYAKPFGYECNKDEMTEDAYGNCMAGRALFEIVNCGYIVAFAREAYNSVCTMMTGGLMNMATGFLMFFLGYNLAFFTFLLGYKRWNTHYTEGYRVDLDGDGKTDGAEDGYINDARSDTAGVEAGDKKGMIGAMCDSLKQGCKGQYRPKVGDVLVFGDGENGSVAVSEDMAKKKSGYKLSKKNSVVPMDDEGM